MATIKACLEAVGCDIDALATCSNLDEEFVVVKKSYFKQVLIHHPDKGGDVAVFRVVQAAFSSLKGKLDEAGISSFVSSANVATEGTAIPSAQPFEFYFAAADELKEPLYRMEKAKSGRSKCEKKCGEGGEHVTIAKDTLRFGRMDSESGTYGNWCHVACWRVPFKVWTGLPDPDECKDRKPFLEYLLSINHILLSGLTSLSMAEQFIVVDHVMNKNNWAKATKKNKELHEKGRKAKATASVSMDTSAASSLSGVGAGARGRVVDTSAASSSLSTKTAFIMPSPGVGGAVATSLSGQTCVITGVFPEVGGGTGLNVGKDRVKAMIQSFGGKVTSSISGKTNLLIVGTLPGMSKVNQARERNIKLMKLPDVKSSLEAGMLRIAADIADLSVPLVITEFSTGWRGNGVALAASDNELVAAAGTSTILNTNHSATFEAQSGPGGRQPFIIECARSGRSTCRTSGATIAAGALRIGIFKQMDKYVQANWHEIEAFYSQQRIKKQPKFETSIEGFESLSDEHKRMIRSYMGGKKPSAIKGGAATKALEPASKVICDLGDLGAAVMAAAAAAAASTAILSDPELDPNHAFASTSIICDEPTIHANIAPAAPSLEVEKIVVEEYDPSKPLDLYSSIRPAPSNLPDEYTRQAKQLLNDMFLTFKAGDLKKALQTANNLFLPAVKVIQAQLDAAVSGMKNRRVSKEFAPTHPDLQLELAHHNTILQASGDAQSREDDANDGAAAVDAGTAAVAIQPVSLSPSKRKATAIATEDETAAVASGLVADTHADAANAADMAAGTMSVEDAKGATDAPVNKPASRRSKRSKTD